MLDNLEVALDRTYEALLRGDLSLLEGLLPETELLAADLRVLDRRRAERLQRKALRNGAMLQAAARGVRAARGRIAEISAGPKLTTYDSSGRKESFGSVTQAMPRRV
jgi:flagellar biosynthesis/type III secretory pathway chaperone